ncbi:MAG: hypothetical protein HWD85_00580 [Flavobacteriaceae bacterium]|nr:hypothetical protein [Flavobacteriaceae bacterium]
MKKIIIVIVFVFAGLSTMNAQRIYHSFESRFVLPSDTPDNRKSGLAISYSPFFTISKDFRALKIAPSIGIYYISGGENLYKDDAFFTTIGGAVDFNLDKSQEISIGGHLGYSVITPEEFDGGLYYRPYIRWGWFMLSYGNVNLKQGNYATFQIGLIAMIDSY